MYMLPKIAVGVFETKKDLLSIFDTEENAVLGFDSEEAKVSDLRSWINSATSILKTRPKYTIVIWNADKLNAECQAVLLKPMEELEPAMRMILAVENENLLLPTILSRAEVEYFVKPPVTDEVYWNEVRKCWSSGPSACIAFVDQLDKEKGILVMEEIIRKLKAGLTDEVNLKRLTILDKAVESLYELKQTNINQKLLLDHFLIDSWRIIKGS